MCRTPHRRSAFKADANCDQFTPVCCKPILTNFPDSSRSCESNLRNFRSSGMLRSVDWHVFADVSGQPIGPISKALEPADLLSCFEGLSPHTFQKLALHKPDWRSVQVPRCRSEYERTGSYCKRYASDNRWFYLKHFSMPRALELQEKMRSELEACAAWLIWQQQICFQVNITKNDQRQFTEQVLKTSFLHVPQAQTSHFR